MNSDAEVQRQQALIQEKLHEVARETGHDKHTVEWIYTSVVAQSMAPHPKEGTRAGVSAETVCDRLVRRANDLCPGGLRIMLEYNHIDRSEDIGEIVTSLVKHELLKREEDDFLTDFDGIFETEHLGAYLKKRGIRRRWMAPGVPRRLALALSATGVALILGNWLHPTIIPNAWLGPILCSSGGLLFLWSRRRNSPAASRVIPE